MHLWYENWLLWLIVAVVICVLVAVVVAMIRLRVTAARRHTLGTLRNIADRLLRDVVLPDGVGGHVGVDVLLLRDNQLYLLLLRHADGAIFAGDKMDQWSVVGRRRFVFHNPLHALQDRAIALRALVPEFSIMPQVLFTGRGHFPKGCPAKVALFEEFAGPLRRKKKPKVMLDAKLEAAWTRLREAAGVPADKEVPAVKSPSAEVPAA
ncbi:MAG: hypothetical protein KGL98_07610 [Gammaproteobacteria bacterium]|nr:hypothetical protein [Gammaproteobacteria bacterium]MBU6509627.1 hypothetical protein [Gammaproteobacteria bacterium]MDE1983717.1 hypothetical protein [Gammaproteobacteria bacterium]MDE2109084.1 hypothetical protein [Gammaproteobacteria bacterium]MDE2461102.1 hypothetical protein [Gammaproteobacteria bacterium]